MKLLITVLFAVNMMAHAAVADTCVEKLEQKKVNREISALYKIKVSKISVVSEISQAEYDAEVANQGRFFKAEVQHGKHKKHVKVWMKPFSQGKACVVRDVVSL